MSESLTLFRLPSTLLPRLTNEQRHMHMQRINQKSQFNNSDSIQHHANTSTSSLLSDTSSHENVNENESEREYPMQRSRQKRRVGSNYSRRYSHSSNYTSCEESWTWHPRKRKRPDSRHSTTHFIGRTGRTDKYDEEWQWQPRTCTRKRKQPPHSYDSTSPVTPPQLKCEPESIESIEPRDNDVLCGRGGSINTHPGNARFRELVEKRKRSYIDAFKREKRLIAESILKDIRRLSPSGRFLTRAVKGGPWVEISEEKARDKTSQGLRENAPKIRRQIQNERRRYEVQQHHISTPPPAYDSRNEQRQQYQDTIHDGICEEPEPNQYHMDRSYETKHHHRAQNETHTDRRYRTHEKGPMLIIATATAPCRKKRFTFDERIEALRSYKRAHGNLHVPMDKCSPTGTLGIWLLKACRDLKRIELGKEPTYVNNVSHSHYWKWEVLKSILVMDAEQHRGKVTAMAFFLL